jgi:hypothetical protein
MDAGGAPAVAGDIAAPARQLTTVPGGGHGIPGMAQRARLAGGAVTAGPAGGQWRVEAVLPVGDRP